MKSTSSGRSMARMRSQVNTAPPRRMDTTTMPASPGNVGIVAGDGLAQLAHAYRQVLLGEKYL